MKVLNTIIYVQIAEKVFIIFNIVIENDRALIYNCK
jgi:hypothetical protein